VAARRLRPRPTQRDPEGAQDALPVPLALGRDAPLGDDARAELLLARAALRRRGVWVRAARLRRPYPRLLVVARVPWLGVVHRSFTRLRGASPR
jgi:hypothetical protein